MTTKIDYSPLNELRPRALKSPLSDITPFSNHLGAVIVSIFSLIVLTALTHHLRTAVISSIFIYIVMWQIGFQGSRSAIRFSNFAIKNGFRYQIGIKNHTAPQDIVFGGVIGASGKRIYASNIISGTYKDINFELFNIYGCGMYSIMRVSLENKYPHIVLDSTFNDSYTASISRFFSDDSRIRLEGDFDSYFKTYSAAPAVDTLRILSPDMMQKMIESGHKYDLEIFEDKLHIISNYKYANERDIRYFFDLANSLMDKLDRRSATRHAIFDHDARVC